jgi:lipid II:glycine glycyltransferase (peptidoglycan interpeptide bridge formation enzyme)
MYSGITKPGEKSCGNYQLMWECLKYFKQRGYNTLDMEGLSDNRLKRQTKRWKNYSDYKMQFGGNIVDYPLPYEKYRFPLL